MKLRFFTILVLLFLPQIALADNINVATFDELIQSGSQSSSGDTITITDNLNSDSSIGNSFYTKDLSFLGQNHSINGGDVFGGFVLSKGSSFDSLRIIKCKGQIYSNSYFGGAIFNTNGTTNINNSAFSGNYANAQGFNFAVGGAVYNYNGGQIDISSTLFDSNFTYGASAIGGALANDSTGNSINISNSVFNNNYTQGSSVSYGGAIYNGNGATMNIKNSLFNDNYSEATSNDAYLYGGSIYNTGNMNIDNSYFSNNHIIGSTNSFSYGGAIQNNSNLTITNSTFNGNYINSDIDTSGGAIYNYMNGNMIIENSSFKNNYINAQNSRGGAIGNEGVITIINSTFKNNKDTNGVNDIYSIGTLNFNGNGTTNVLSGIKGSGILNKNDSGILNLGGNNSNYTGTFDLTGGTVNLLNGAQYFKAKITNLYNNTNFNLQNNQIDNINFGIASIYGTTNLYPDVNFNSNTMDTIQTDSLTGSGIIYVPNLKITGTPSSEYIRIPFADNALKNAVKYNSQTIKSPIYNYISSYNMQDGNFIFSREDFNTGIMSSSVASQLGVYIVQTDIFNDVFSNLDMVMLATNKTKTAYKFKNMITYNGNDSFIYSPFEMPEDRQGMWIKPYSTLENVPLKNGPKISNIGYGSIFGQESQIKELKKGWKYIYGLYGAYTGSHQAYDGIGINNNGGAIGLVGGLYKNNFYSLWSINTGANTSRAYTDFGTDNFNTFYTGIAQKSGINLSVLDNKLIIQPNLLLIYSFVNTFDYSTASGVNISTQPINSIHIEPQIKFIGNLEGFVQPYAAVSVAGNVMNNSRFKADDISLPELSIKPYVRYGVGVQTRWGDKFTGFIQSYVTSGGRNGIGFQLGMRISLGKEKGGSKIRKGNIPIKPKPQILLSSIIHD